MKRMVIVVLFELVLCFAVNGQVFAQASAAQRPRLVPQEVVVAVIDSGIDINNKKFTPHLWVNEQEIADNNLDDDKNGYIDDRIGYDATNRKGSAQDEQGHGTQVSSVVLGISSKNFPAPAGFEYKIKILPVKWNVYATGAVKDVVEALRYVLAFAESHRNTPVIINASWFVYGENLDLKELIWQAKKLGILFVASAGNNGSDKPYAPAVYEIDNVVSVGATHGSELWLSSNQQFTIAAEGVGIKALSLNNDPVVVDGTSYSSPLVARTAAFLWAKNPNWSYALLKQTLLDNSSEVPETSLHAKGRLLDYNKTLLSLRK